MKRIILIIGVAVFVYACSTQHKAVRIDNIAAEITEEDSVEYELETFDGKFDSWYQMYKSPAMYRSQSYYESWNRQYVTAWNYNAMNSSKSWFFETIIGYEPNTDYGFELNHELFYYFQYVEYVLKTKIMSGGPRSTFH